MKLSTRLLLPLVGMILLVMLAYSVWAVRVRERTLASEARRETEAYAAAVNIAIDNAVRRGGMVDVQEIVDRLSQASTIYGVLVYDDRARLVLVSEPLRLHGTTRPAILRRVLETGETARIHRRLEDQRVFSVLRPIRGTDGRVVGAFEVAQSLDFLEAEIGRTRQRFLLNTITLLAAVVIITLWLVRRLIARPLGRLLDAVRALGRGELAHRIHEDPGGGELAELAREFNAMAERLEAARGDLLRQTEERISLERRLRETEKLAAVGQLAAGVAHEIAAPLNVIAGRADLVRRRELPPAERERNLRIIADQVGRITRIVRDLLDFSRRREPRPEPVALAPLLQGVVDLVEPELRRLGIHVSIEAEEPVQVMADPALLHQVFMNLFLNAVQALEDEPGERRITIRAAREDAPGGTDVAVVFQDTGPGIPEDLLPRIFQPFFTTKGGGQGTGLGLAIARSIIEEHGGRIDAIQAHHGACFRIVLPATPATEAVHA